MSDLLSSEKGHIKIDVSNKRCHICTTGRWYMNFLAKLLPHSRGRSLACNIKAIYLLTRLINYAKVKQYWLTSSQPQYKAQWRKENITLSDRFLHKTGNKNERLQNC